MANIPFKSIMFPGLPNKYTVPEISNDLMTAGKAADAKATGDALSALEDAVTEETDKLKADLGAQANGLIAIKLISGKYVNPSTGQYVSRTGAYAIDYISCIPGDTVLINTASASSYGAWYDANKERVSSLSLVSGNNYLKVPDAARYFATSTLDDSVSGIKIYSKLGVDSKSLVEKVSYFNESKAVAIGAKNVISDNLYDASNTTQGYYLNGTAGTPVANDSYAYTGYILLDGDSYSYSSNIATAGIYFYDANYNLLSPLARTVQNYTNANTWPMGTKYCRFNLNISIINAITFTTSKNTGYYISESQIVKNEYNINVGSTRNYKTLKSAIDYINSIGDNTATYNILIDAGTYNALDGYDLSTQTSTFMGIVLPDNTNIIGESSPANVIIAVDGTSFPDNINKNEISVLNLYRNNIVKNVTVKSKNIRYGLHDDDSYRATGAVSDAIQIFENVHFINEARTVTGTASYCAGIGAKKGQTLTFKNCFFDNRDTTYCAIGAHNGTTAEKPVTYNFENCKFACNGSYGLRMTTTVYNILDIVNLYGCKSNKNILLDRASSNENTNTGFKFFGYGNTGLTFSASGIVLNESDTEMMM